MNISPFKYQTIKDFSVPQRFVRAMELKGLAPLIMLECFVTGGRTYQAHKRGGFVEARERFTEEAIGAAFWFGGVKVFNRINDFILKKMMGIKNTDFDAHSDSIRKPLANYMKWAEENGQKLSKNKIAAFKFTKIATSILLANALVGFVVPKINQGITRAYHKGKEEQQAVNNNQNLILFDQEIGMSQFVENAQKKNAKKDVAFTGGNLAQTLLSLSHKFENDTIYQLLSTDIGISGGRAISARNNNERIEVLWRDISSIFFYMFSMPLINKAMNKLQIGSPARLNPVGAKQVTEYMKTVLDQNEHKDASTGKISVQPNKFTQIMLGDAEAGTQMMGKVQPEFKNGAIRLDKFLEVLEREFSPEDFKKYSDLATRMSKLQPQVEGVSVLAESQAKAIFQGGAINVPEFWDNVFTVAKGVDSKTGIANHKNPFRFIAQSDLDDTIDQVAQYVKGTIKDAKGKNITVDMLEKAYKNNMFKNALNWSVAFGVSAFCLSTVIPKIQYWITKTRTGSDEFPGVAEFKKS